MSTSEFESFAEQILGAYRHDTEPDDALVLADYFAEQGDLKLTASALDRAYGLSQQDPGIGARREEVLDQLELIEHGLRFRYVPAGSYLMGSDRGDHDESPVHPIRLGEFWVAELPTTWATFSDLINWTPPPYSRPANKPDNQVYGCYAGEDQRSIYSMVDSDIAEDLELYQDLRASVGEDHERDLAYDLKPIVGIAQPDAAAMCATISTDSVEYRLPSEAEWERAARGGLLGKTFAWGDEPPTTDNCDHNRFGEDEILFPKETFRNGYGLYAMCGTVSEWTEDLYDSQAYRQVEQQVKQDEQTPGLLQRLTRRFSPRGRKGNRAYSLRGGSWTDCADAVSVSFRMSRDSVGWESDEHERRQHNTPTIGFRIFRFNKQ